MGIDIRDKLMVGAKFTELTEFFDKIIELGETDEHEALENPYEVIEVYFETMSPYYDSDKEDWFVGFNIYNNKVFDQATIEDISELAKAFKELTGVEAKLKGGAHVF